MSARIIPQNLLLSLLFSFHSVTAMAHHPLILDDRRHADLASNLGTPWRLVSDTVMGGVSAGRLEPVVLEGRPCLRLTGMVSLENQGGFLQMSLDLGPDGELDASAYTGVELTTRGNGETYNVHLRNRDTRVVWQSYRAGFQAGPDWRTVRLPFAEFRPYRIDRPLSTRHLRRLGLVAIGREMTADLCVARIAFY
ncbi:MAG: CIA30 family protein [Thiobacillaceae bacterium]|jgi:hypothetical protein|nr:CIA30 family protein [Thiobacillaceae bacterium]